MQVKHETTSEKVIEIMDDYTPITSIEGNKIVKTFTPPECKGVCDCKECDDISGDNITW